MIWSGRVLVCVAFDPDDAFDLFMESVMQFLDLMTPLAQETMRPLILPEEVVM